MKLWQNYRLMAAYAFFALWSGISFFLVAFHVSAHYLTALIFLNLIFVSGFSLSRLFKVGFSNDRWGNLALFSALGFILLFASSFLAIMLKWPINLLVIIYLSLIGAIFVISAILDTFRRPTGTPEISSKPNIKQALKEFFLNNLTSILVVVITVLIGFAVVQQGANFKGDPQYHLATIQKAAGTAPLSVSNLSYVKDNPEEIYAYPVWHVALAIMSKLTHFNIFETWSTMVLPLVILFMIAVGFLMRQMLPNKELANLALIAFSIFIFATNKGYLFLRLPVPDTLNQYILLPLAVALALKYIFNKENLKILAVFSLSVIFLAVVHFTQYFYFLLIFSVFALIYAIFFWWTEDFKATIKRILLALFANVLLLAPFLILLEIKLSLVSRTIKEFWNSPLRHSFNAGAFHKIDLRAKVASILAPLALIFTRKKPQMIFTVSIFVVAPLAFIDPFKMILTKLFTGVFMDRLYYNVTYFAVIWALIPGFLFLILDRAMKKWPKIYVYLASGLATVLALALIYAQVKFTWAKNLIEKTLDNPHLSAFLNRYYLYFVIGFTILALAGLLWQKYSKKAAEFFTWEKYHHRYLVFLLIFMTAFLIAAPQFRTLKNYYKREIDQKMLLKKPYNSLATILNPSQVGDLKTIDFINKNIPPKKVFVTNSGYLILPMLSDVHMPIYTKSWNAVFKNLFNPEYSIKNKIIVMKHFDLDYLMIVLAKNQNREFYNKYPEQFTLVYDGKALIYKINKDKLSLILDNPTKK